MAQNLTNQRPMSNYKAGTRAGAGVNDAPVHNGAKSTHNLFPMSYQLCTTARYGEIAPFFVFNAEAKDQIPLKSAFELRTLALNSPMMSRLFMKRAYFEVKQNAVLPRTFEYIYKNPIHGDDVPADAYCNVGRSDENFVDSLFAIFQRTVSYIEDQDNIESGGMTEALRDSYIALGRSLFLLESIYSSGSLLANLGCPLNGYANVGLNSSDFDTWLSEQIDIFLTGGTYEDYYRQVPVFSFPELLHFKDQENQTSLFSCVEVNTSMPGAPTIQVVSKNRLIELLRSYTPETVFFYDSLSGTLIDGDASISNNFYIPSNAIFNLPSFGIDLMRIAAYQLTCAEWYTNDKVDYIYNADLWRKSMDFFVKQVLGSVDFFEYNDISIMYDALSAHNFNAMSSFVFNMYDPSDDISKTNFWLDYLSNLFFFNRSLKFEDYFSGSRTRPLAVGENTISDSSDPIEVVRGIQLTRFLNAVNRAGLDEKYLKEIYGTLPLPSDLIPRWITTVDNQIESFEVNNTGEEQGKMTTALRTQVGTDEGSTSVVIEGYPSILLGLYSFEVPRLYVDAIDRDFFVQDRFDMFNPYFQYDGDQAIYRDELYPITGEAAGTSFAYTGRDNHRKLRVSRATGGFVKNLPSWSFIVDDQKNGIPYAHLNPEFILSSCTEFDRFFGSLTGFTLDSYFHFIVSFVNDCNAYRAMEYSPAILNG